MLEPAVAIVSVVASTIAMWALNPFRVNRGLDAAVLAFFGTLLAALAWIAQVPLSFPLLYLVVACVPPLLAAVLITRRRRLGWHARGVLDPFDRARGLASLRAHLSKKRPLEQAQDARRVAAELAHAELFDEAASILADVPVERISERWSFERAVIANDLTAYRLRLGELEGAREALESVSERPRSIAPILATKEALLMALEGEPDEALSLLARTTLPARSPHRATLELALAHAHAARGDVDRARDALRALAKREPKRWITLASKPSGPATPLAAALAAERSSPYR